MIDREKAMSWLEGLAEPDWRECYSDSEVQETARQALDLIDELLKEQEAMPVRYSVFGRLKYGACPKCGARVDDLVYPKACGFCGQAVKWNG